MTRGKAFTSRPVPFLLERELPGGGYWMADKESDDQLPQTSAYEIEEAAYR